MASNLAKDAEWTEVLLGLCGGMYPGAWAGGHFNAAAGLPIGLEQARDFLPQFSVSSAGMVEEFVTRQAIEFEGGI